MKLFWILHKDLLTESRSWQVWPAMLVLALVVGFLFRATGTSPGEGLQAAARQFWLATFFAGMLALNRTFEAEQECDCWGALVLYPASPRAIFGAKLLGNALALAAIQCVLVLLFGLMHPVPIFRWPGHVAMILILGNLGIASVGTIVAALSATSRHGPGLLAVLALPLVAPLLLVAIESTRLLLGGAIDRNWWDGAMLLATFSVAFCALGMTLSPFLFEE